MVTLEKVKELRQISGAGILDCQKALKEHDGNLEKAIEWLRKKGITKAIKKSGRISADGSIILKFQGNNNAIISEINTETDFVAKNEKFQVFSDNVVQSLFNLSSLNLENIKKAKYLGGNTTIEEEVTNQISIVGENINIRRAENLQVKPSEGFVFGYIHNAYTNNQGKIGVLLAVETNGSEDKVSKFTRQIAMHIAASNVVAIDKDSVPSDLIAKEKEVLTEQSKATGKPDNIIENMVKGKIAKFFREIVLLDQVFVIDGKETVSNVIKYFEKENNIYFKIKSFKKYTVGEGIKKQDNNFT